MSVETGETESAKARIRTWICGVVILALAIAVFAAPLSPGEPTDWYTSPRMPGLA